MGEIMKKQLTKILLSLVLILPFFTVTAKAASGMVFISFVDDVDNVTLTTANFTSAPIATDGTTNYLLSSISSSVYYLYLGDLSKDLTFKVAAKVGDNEFEGDIPLTAAEYAGSSMSSPIKVHISDSILKAKPVPFDAYFKVVDKNGDPLSNITVQTSADYGSHSQTGKTNAFGIAVVTVPEAPTYFVGPVYNKSWHAIANDPTMDQLKATSETNPFILTILEEVIPDYLEDCTLSISAYLDGNLFKNTTTTGQLSYKTTYIKPSGLTKKGICELIETTMQVNGVDYDFTVSKGSSTGTDNIQFSTKNMTHNANIDIRFYYSYTDTDMLYQIGTIHSFYKNINAFTSENLITSETDEVIYAKPGQEFTVQAQNSKTEPNLHKNFEGYTNGTFVLSQIVSNGGSQNSVTPVLKYPDKNPDYYVFTNDMEHCDFTIIFRYGFVPYNTICFSNLKGDNSVEESGTYAPISLDANTQTELPQNPTRDGYIFEGWMDSENDTLIYYESDKITMNDKDITLVALWEKDENKDNIEDKYQTKVTFEITDGKWDDMTSNVKEAWVSLYGSNHELSETGTGYVKISDIPQPLYPDYGFDLGTWNNDPYTQIIDNSGFAFVFAFEPDMKTVEFDDDRMDHQKIEAFMGVTIRINPNGGSYNGKTDPTEIVVEENINVIAPNRPGYLFKGWQMDEDPDTFLILTATWEKPRIPDTSAKYNGLTKILSIIALTEFVFCQMTKKK